MDAVAAATSAAPAAPLFRVEYTPTADEFVEASLIPFRARRVRNVIFTLACAPIIVFIGWLEHSNVTMCFAAVFALVAIFQPFLTRRLLRDYFHKHPQFSECSVATYWPQGLLVQTASVEMLVRWHAFTHFTESKRLFLLHRGPGNPLFLAKRVFADAAALESYRQLLTHYIGRTSQEQRHGFPIEPVASPLAPAPAPHQQPR
jgi:hypothetical protein